jgi:hypothetical protein
MCKFKEYDKDLAIKLNKEFLKRTGFDFKVKNREPLQAGLRSLLYSVLRRNGDMNDRCIKDFFAEYGYTSNLSAISVGRRKLEYYYKEFDIIREMYDSYFNDKQKAFLLKEKKKELLKEGDKLMALVHTIPEHRKQEVYDLVNLKIKSWSWKNKDNCKVYTSNYIELSE